VSTAGQLKTTALRDVAMLLTKVFDYIRPGDALSLRVYSTAEPIGPRVVNVRVGE